MTETIQLRQKNPEETEKMAQFESPDGDDVCASYISRKIAEAVGEYAAVTISGDDDGNVNLDNVSGSGSGNFVERGHWAPDGADGAARFGCRRFSLPQGAAGVEAAAKEQ